MSVSNDQAVMATLFEPLRDGRIPMADPARCLFLRAVAGPELRWLGRALVCRQGFKPYADALTASGYSVAQDRVEGQFDLVLLLPSRQRGETRASLVDAAECVGDQGCILMAGANNAGAKSLQDDAARLFGTVQSACMNKCRAIWSLAADRSIDRTLAHAWRQAMRPVQVPGTTLFSAPGMFSYGHVDPGSALLAAHLPDDLRGAGADLGAGWGYLSDHLLRHCAGVQRLHLYDADFAALRMAQRNLEAWPEAQTRFDFRWADVTQGLPDRYDFVVSNPPFHQQRAGQPEIGLGFIRAAAGALNAGGRFWMVANRHLPYEAELSKSFGRVHKHADEAGFKVFEAIKERR